MNKTFIRALVLGLLFVVIYYLIQIIKGMYFTMNYIPNMQGKYESIDLLSSTSNFGDAHSPLWRTIEVVGMMLLGIVVYYTGKLLRRKK